MKLRTINNPESMTTGTEDLSSGASNRSKTTMGTDSDYLHQPSVSIQLESESKKRIMKAEQKKGLDIIEIRDSSSKERRSRKSKNSEQEEAGSNKRQRLK